MLPPLRTLSVEINNISITQPQVIVDEERGEMAGKFIKLFVHNQMNYYTEIIFNGEFNSILWKLSGCLFT
jgi:ribosomal protein L31E